MRSSARMQEAIRVTMPAAIGDKWALDVVKMSLSEGMACLVIAREDVTGWPEARALRSGTSEAVAKFLFEDIICRHGVMKELTSNNGSENKKYTKVLLEAYGVKHI